MLSIKTILEDNCDKTHEEKAKIRNHIEENILLEEEVVKKIFLYRDKEGPHDPQNDYQKYQHGLYGDHFHILLYGFIQKKITKQLYSLNSFKEGLEVIKKVDYKANLVLDNKNYDDKYGWVKKVQTGTDILKDKNKEYEEIPAEHGVAFALCQRLKRHEYDFKNTNLKIEDYLNKTKEWGNKDFEEKNKLIKNNFQKYIGNSTYKKFGFNKFFPKNKSDIGENKSDIGAYVFLLLDQSIFWRFFWLGDKSNDGKAILFAPINKDSQEKKEIVDLLFHMLFYAYLHNTSLLTTMGFKNKIKKFGFLHPNFDFDDKVSNIFEYKSDKLTSLFVELHNKLKNKNPPINPGQRLCAGLKNNATTIAIVCSSSGMVSLIGWLTK